MSHRKAIRPFKAGAHYPRALLLMVLIVFSPWLSHRLLAADLSPSTTANQSFTVPLEYQETDFGAVNWGLNVEVRSEPFKDEPTVATGKTLRGVLKFGNNSSNAIPYLWQRDAGRLILDFNRNEDLTDDPDGVFVVNGDKKVPYQTFAVRMALATPKGNCKVRADVHMYDYGSRPSCSASLRSFWGGKVNVAGQDWQVGVIPDRVLFDPQSITNCQMLLRRLEKQAGPAQLRAMQSAGINASDTLPFLKKLCIDGVAYDLELTFAMQDGEPLPTLKFTEEATRLGELKLKGKFIDRVAFNGDRYVVVLGQPGEAVKIPVGSYTCESLSLKKDKAVARRTTPKPLEKRISISEKVPAELDLGGPLTNSIAVSRHGGELRLDYLLLGANGDRYQLETQNSAKPPKFTVTQAGKQIASGTFEFG